MRTKTLVYVNLASFWALFIITAGLRFLSTPPEIEPVQLLAFSSFLRAILEYLLLFSWNLGLLTLKRYQDERRIKRQRLVFGGAIILIVTSFFAVSILDTALLPPVEGSPLSVRSFEYGFNGDAPSFNILRLTLCNSGTEQILITSQTVQTYDGTRWSDAPYVYSFFPYTLKPGGCGGKSTWFIPPSVNPVDYRFVVTYRIGEGELQVLIGPLWSEYNSSAIAF
ncbi:MAG: hypothetical protein ACFFFG_11880 [Candidatus Thorarchaeota archaeon]